MKRSIHSLTLEGDYEDYSQPDSKIIKKPCTGNMDLSEAMFSVNGSIHISGNVLGIAEKQWQNASLFEGTNINAALHQVTCNFIKKPGHVYHLYKKHSGHQYLGMLSPEEWQIVPHLYLGSYLLEPDFSWTPVIR